MAGEDDGRWDKNLRSKGLLPAVGVGAAVYFITGLVSVSTLGLVGVGAGVGYGVGSWLADAYQKKQDDRTGGAPGQQGGHDALPWAMQVSLQQWQGYLATRVQGGQMSPQLVESIFAEFEQREPVHAQNVRNLVSAGGASSSSGGIGSTPVVGGYSGGVAEV
mmetsp:Transcript_70610/g.185100  ORF Transcript_70610/g.185100 Transcript_70610/m.185100 type:complete len:162 (-) Transcript_70610:405-890(-)